MPSWKEYIEYKRICYLQRTYVKQYDFDTIDPWSKLQASAAWAICITHYSPLKAFPAQAVWGQDMLFNIKFITDWEAVRIRKQLKLFKNNNR